MTSATLKHWGELMSNGFRIDLGAILGALAAAGVVGLFAWILTIQSGQSEQASTLVAQKDVVQRVQELQDTREARDAAEFDALETRLVALEVEAAGLKSELKYAREDLKRILGKLERIEAER